MILPNIEGLHKLGDTPCLRIGVPRINQLIRAPANRLGGRGGGALSFVGSCLAMIALLVSSGMAATIIGFEAPSGEVFATTDISDDGSAVTGEPGALRWTQSGGSRDLTLLPGGTYNKAEALTANGSTVVGWGDSSAGTRGWLWREATGFQILSPLAGGTSSLAFGVNRDGSVVVGSSGNRAVRWVGGTAQNLGVVSGGSFSIAFGVNSDGSVVCGYNRVGANNRAFRWTVAGGMQDLGVLPGKTQSISNAVSADGQVVVGGSHTSLGGSSVAFRWTVGGGMQSLGTLGTMDSIGFDLTGDGSTVVGSSGDKAFLWTASLGMVDLNTYLPSLGLDLTGWKLEYAAGISTDGSSIVGNGLYQGQQTAFLVQGIVPEPSSALLAFAAGIAVMLRRERRVPSRPI